MGLHELKPCPFCGGEAGLSSVGTSYMAHCYTPNCIMEVTPYFASVENAVDAWNKRAHEGGAAASKNQKSGENAFDGAGWEWLLPLFLLSFLEPPHKREITINAKSNSKSVNITYDPHDAEAVKAAEAWRKALFSAVRWTYEEPVAVRPGDTVTFTGQRCRDYQPTLDALKKAVKRKVYTYTEDRNGDVTVRVDTPFDLTKQTELEKASEPLRDYLKAHGDPHTSVIVTQYGATEMQGERRVKFEGGAT